MKKDPENASLKIALGEAFLSRKEYARSIKLFAGALELDRKNIKAINGIAKAFFASGLFYSANEYLKKLMGISRSQPDTRRMLSAIKKYPAAEKQKVTFYIPCYNAEKYIARCIEGIIAQTYPIEEILVCDDGSTDKTIEIAARYPVTVIRHKENKGLSHTRNTAIQAAKGDYVASVDVDVVPDKYWLEYLMMDFTDAKIAGCGGKLIEQYTLTVIDRWRQVNMRQNLGDRPKANPANLFGCDTVFRKKCLQDVGGYNEQFKVNHEDTDLSRRIKMLHYRLLYEPRAIARHLRTDDCKSLFNTYWRYYKAVRGELFGYFTDFHTLKWKVNYDLSRSHALVTKSVQKGTAHLAYLDIISGFRDTLENIIHVGNYSKLPHGLVAETFLATLAGFRHAMMQKEGVSGELVNFAMDDLKDLAGFLAPEYRSRMDKLGIFSGPGPGKFLKNYKKIKAVLPNANFIFVAFTLKTWNSRFNLGPLVWKMIEVSARRMHYEKTYNPNLMRGPRVMLVNPPWRNGRRSGVRAGSRWPFTMDVPEGVIPGYIPFPFFLAYAAALLKKNGINTVIVDAIAEGLTDEEFTERVRGFSPDLVLLEAATPSIETDLEWAEKVKGLDTRTRIAFSGTHVSALGAEFLRDNGIIDYLIIGEYEFAFLELARALKDGRSPAGIPGVAYRDERGALISQGRTAGVARIDDLPWPERITLPMYNYNDTGSGTPAPTVQIMASRGCPFGCIYCLWPQVLYGNKKYRPRRERDVVNEMEVMIMEYGFKGVYFDDDTFNIGKERILRLCAEINRRSLGVPWSIMARADTSDYETLKAMRDAGLCAIKFGVESGSQELVDACQKGLRLAAVEQAVQDCRRLGIKVHLTFTFGLPGETQKTVEQTINYALKLDADSAQFSLTTPFPGTAYYRMLEDKGLLVQGEWSRYDGDRYAVFRGDSLSARDLEAAVRKARQVWEAHAQGKELRQDFFVPSKGQIAAGGRPKARIAIVDLLFTWPPRGGAAQDIHGIAANLVKKGFTVQMFVPLYKYLLTRGYIASALSFPVQQIYFKKNDFVPEIISRRLKEAVDNFEPDYVIIGDGWSLKPHVAAALKKYKTFLRFYAYENLCLIRNGILLKGDAPCPYNFLANRDKCLDCIGERIMKKGVNDEGIKELLLAHGFTVRFHGLLREAIRQSAGVIVYNSFIAGMLSRLNKNIHIIPSGVDIDKFCVSGVAKSDSGRKNILMTGRVEDRAKGLHVLEKACEKLWKKRKDFIVTLTSRTEMQAPYFRSAGWLSADKLPRLYRQADICVFPSIWPEPFGIVALESMAAAKPVIASRTGGLSKIVVDKKTGFLVKPGDADELAQKLEILLDDHRLRDTMGKMGRVRAKELYNWDTIVKKYYLPLFART